MFVYLTMFAFLAILFKRSHEYSTSDVHLCSTLGENIFHNPEVDIEPSGLAIDHDTQRMYFCSDQGQLVMIDMGNSSHMKFYDISTFGTECETVANYEDYLFFISHNSDKIHILDKRDDQFYDGQVIPESSINFLNSSTRSSTVIGSSLIDEEFLYIGHTHEGKIYQYEILNKEFPNNITFEFVVEYSIEHGEELTGLSYVEEDNLLFLIFNEPNLMYIYSICPLRGALSKINWIGDLPPSGMNIDQDGIEVVKRGLDMYDIFIAFDDERHTIGRYEFSMEDGFVRCNEAKLINLAAILLSTITPLGTITIFLVFFTMCLCFCSFGLMIMGLYWFQKSNNQKKTIAQMENLMGKVAEMDLDSPLVEDFVSAEIKRESKVLGILRKHIMDMNRWKPYLPDTFFVDEDSDDCYTTVSSNFAGYRKGTLSLEVEGRSSGSSQSYTPDFTDSTPTFTDCSSLHSDDSNSMESGNNGFISKSLRKKMEIKLQKKCVSILIVDVEGIRDILEDQTKLEYDNENLGSTIEEYTSFHSEYLMIVEEVVRKYRGMFYSVCGTRIVVSWNSSYDNFDHIQSSISSSLEIMKALKNFADTGGNGKNIHFSNINCVVVQGCGLCGTIGSKQQKSWAILGHVIRKAELVFKFARCQNGNTVMVCDLDRDFLVKKYTIRRIDKLIMPGGDSISSARGINLIEILGETGDEDCKFTVDDLEDYELAYEYFQNNEFRQALRSIERYIESNENDPLGQRLKTRIMSKKVGLKARNECRLFCTLGKSF